MCLAAAPPIATLELEDNERSEIVFTQAVDTQLHEVFPHTDYSTTTTYTVDSADGGGEAQVLLRFDNLFGDGAGQIPLDANIISATLQMVAFNDGDSISFYRMLRWWQDSDTWNGLSGGVQTDNLEAAAIADVRTGHVDIGNLTVDVLSSLENWQADPAGNFGWLLRGGGRGVDLLSAESHEAPRLLVQYDRRFDEDPDSASISGTLWIDENSDAVIDPNETRLGKRTVYLDANQNGRHDFGELFRLSAADGSYSFAGLPASGYTVIQRVEPGYEQISPAGPAHPNGAYFLALGVGETAANVNFGNQIETVTVTWPNPADIIFGTALSTVQLNATADQAGTFVYTPPLGTVLNAGPSQSLTVTFTPDDLTTFDPVSAEVLIKVLAADPMLGWTDPNPIVFGTLLGDQQLNASSNVAGIFTYDPARRHST